MNQIKQETRKKKDHKQPDSATLLSQKFMASIFRKNGIWSWIVESKTNSVGVFGLYLSQII